MTFNDSDRVQIAFEATSSLDLTTATSQLNVDQVAHTCTWTAVAIDNGKTGADKRWTRRGRTTDWFAGPTAPNTVGDTVLPYGVHELELVVTAADGTIKADQLPSLTVRHI